jgi:hypothetical protein
MSGSHKMPNRKGLKDLGGAGGSLMFRHNRLTEVIILSLMLESPMVAVPQSLKGCREEGF